MITEKVDYGGLGNEEEREGKGKDKDGRSDCLGDFEVENGEEL